MFLANQTQNGGCTRIIDQAIVSEINTGLIPGRTAPWHPSCNDVSAPFRGKSILFTSFPREGCFSSGATTCSITGIWNILFTGDIPDGNNRCEGQYGIAIVRLHAADLTGIVTAYDWSYIGGGNNQERGRLRPTGGQMNIESGSGGYRNNVFSRLWLNTFVSPRQYGGRMQRFNSGLGSEQFINFPSFVNSYQYYRSFWNDGYHYRDIVGIDDVYFIPGEDKLFVVRLLNALFTYNDPISVAGNCMEMIRADKIMVVGDNVGRIKTFDISNPFVTITLIDSVNFESSSEQCVYLKKHPDNEYVYYAITDIGNSYVFSVNQTSHEIDYFHGPDALMPTNTTGIVKRPNPGSFGSVISIGGWNNQVVMVDAQYSGNYETYTACLFYGLLNPIKLPGNASTDINPRGQIVVDKSSFPAWPRGVLLPIRRTPLSEPKIMGQTYCGSGQDSTTFPLNVTTYDLPCDYDTMGEPSCCDLNNCLFLDDTYCCREPTLCSDNSICTYGNRTCPSSALYPNGTVCTPENGCVLTPGTCNGVNTTCSEPTLQPNGTECTPVGPCTEIPGTCIGPICSNATYYPPIHVCFNSTLDCQADGTCDFGNATCGIPPIEPDGTPCGDTFPDYSCISSRECVSGICEGGIPKPKGDDCSVDGETCMITECDGEGVCEVLDDSECPQNMLPSQRNVDLPVLQPSVSNHDDDQWIAVVVVVSSIFALSSITYIFLIAGRKKRKDDKE